MESESVFSQKARVSGMSVDPRAGGFAPRMRFKSGARGSIALLKTMVPYIAQSWMGVLGFGSLTKAQCELLAKGMDLPGQPHEEAALAARMIQSGIRACQLVEDGAFSFDGKSFEAIYRAQNGQEAQGCQGAAEALEELSSAVSDSYARALYALLLALLKHPSDAAWDLPAAVFMEASLASGGYAPLIIPARDCDLFRTRLRAFLRDRDSSQMLELFRSVIERGEAVRRRRGKGTAPGSFFPYFPD
ncbi:MAG: hypothetical protein ACI4NA_08045 [Succinivibrio sp.]